MTRMMQINDRPATRLASCLVLLGLAGPVPARAAAEQRSLVRCTPVAMPARAPGPGHRMVLRMGDGRFFAPTRQAMFFSRPGDRCAWHATAVARG